MLTLFDDHGHCKNLHHCTALLLHLPPDELGEKVDGDGEHDGAVALRRDAVEGLQVAQLQRPGARRDHLTRSAQSGACLLLALRRYHLPAKPTLM